MSERCDDTELLVTECACKTCRPDLAKVQPAAPVRVAVQFVARYNSRCDHCERQIVAGEQMAYDRDEQRVCKRHLR